MIEMMLAGAVAVEVGAANLVDPYACRDIILALPDVMKQYGITSLSDIIGAAKHVAVDLVGLAEKLCGLLFSVAF